LIKEYQKRRAKRENKERTRSYDAETPGFSFAPGLGDSLFPSPGVGPQGDTNQAGLLLANALLGGEPGTSEQSVSAAHALKAALQAGTVKARHLNEALRVMAGDPDVMKGINRILGNDNDDDGSGDEVSHTIRPSIETPHGLSVIPDRGDNDSHITDAISAATAMVNGQPNPQNSNVSGIGFTPVNIPTTTQPASSIESYGLDQSQIEALLALENGRLISASEGQDGDQANPSSAHISDESDSYDNDFGISAGMQHMIKSGFKSTSTNPDGQSERLQSSSNEPASQVLQNQTHDKINSFLDTNLYPSTTLQIYHPLSSESPADQPSLTTVRRSTQASAFGSPASMNRKLLARNSPFDRSQTVPRAATPSKRRPKTADEERRVKAFGYPPGPGANPTLIQSKE
jgi:hypothetical protein